MQGEFEIVQASLTESPTLKLLMEEGGEDGVAMEITPFEVYINDHIPVPFTGVFPDNDEAEAQIDEFVPALAVVGVAVTETVNVFWIVLLLDALSLTVTVRTEVPNCPLTGV